MISRILIGIQPTPEWKICQREGGDCELPMNLHSTLRGLLISRGNLVELRGSNEFWGGGVSFLFYSIHIPSDDVSVSVVICNVPFFTILPFSFKLSPI